jgi:hypothetical protein
MSPGTIEKIKQELTGLSPEGLEIVRGFIDDLRAQRFSQFTREIPGDDLAEQGMQQYLETLCDYEERLARGELHWQ